MYVGQYFLNLIDHITNTIILGDPNETVSARTARARLAGQKWAIYFCNFLTFGAKVVTLGEVTRDHCQYALDKSVLPNSREIFDLNTMKFHEKPITKIDDVEIN
jgi:hypothetical protein